jgi:hypothetical protein
LLGAGGFDRKNVNQAGRQEDRAWQSLLKFPVRRSH